MSENAVAELIGETLAKAATLNSAALNMNAALLELRLSLSQLAAKLREDAGNG
jgi:hypothetical protein